MATTRGGHVLLPLPLLLLTARCALAQSSSSPSPPWDNTNPYFGAPSFNPTMAIVIVFFVSAFLFVGFLSIYIRHCAGAAAGPRGPARGGSARSRRLLLQDQQRGLSPEVLETFPTLVYAEVKGLKLGKGALECAVCLSEFEDDDTLRLLPRCNHAFHPDCIDAWLASHVTCPVCRCNLAEAANTAAADLETPHVVAIDNPAPETPRTPPERREEDPPRPPSMDHVAIFVDQTPGEDNKEELVQIERQRREVGSRSGPRPPKLLRSHSTGHSVVLPGENVDRYTLRLPEHVRRQIFAAQKLHRSTSCITFPTADEGSSRRGYRSTGDGGGGGGAGEGSSRGGRSVRLGRSDRWPSFFIRTLSARVTSWGTGRRADGGEGSVKKGEGKAPRAGSSLP